MKRSLFALLAFSSLSAEETILQATEARLGLRVPAVRERHTDIRFPIRWWSWSDTRISFTSPQDGTIDLMPTGPWAQEKNQPRFRNSLFE